MTPISHRKPLRRWFVRCVVKAVGVFEFAFHDRSRRGRLDDMRLGVADRNRTSVDGITTRGSAIELRPPQSARNTGLDGRIRTDAGTCRLICNQAPSTTWLRRARNEIPVTGSGAAQSLRPVCVAERERSRDFGCHGASRRTRAGDHPPGRRALWPLSRRGATYERFRSRVPEPPNRCGRFASRSVSAPATSG